MEGTRSLGASTASRAAGNMDGPPPPGGTPREYRYFSTATPSPRYCPSGYRPSPRSYGYPETRNPNGDFKLSCPRPPNPSPRYTSDGYYSTANVTENQRLSYLNPPRYPSFKSERRKSFVESDKNKNVEIGGRTYAIPPCRPSNYYYYSSDQDRRHYNEESGTTRHYYEQGGDGYHHGSPKSSPRRARTATTPRPIAGRSSSHCRVASDITPNTAVVRATEADAKRFNIPAGYSLKNWDPQEEPILLLGSVFDANSLGKWIYDWTVYHHGPAEAISDMAGELWLLLTQLAGKPKRSKGCMPNIRSAEPEEIVEDFIEAGERLMENLRKRLEKCRAYLRYLLRNQRKIGLISLAVLSAGAPMTAAALEWERRVGPLLGIAANAAAASSAVAIVPLRTMTNIDQAYWIAAYSVWAVAFSAIFLMELSQHRPGLRRKLFVALAFILSVHLFGFVSSENASVIDGLTIFGPLMVTISVYLMSVLFEANLNIFTAVLQA